MWYSRIADLYDGLVQFDEDIPFFVDQCARAGGSVLELMAGTGRVSVPLLEAGVRLTCVDSSPEMLAVLRQKLAMRGLSATVLQADVRYLQLPQEFGLAILPFNSFSELVAESDRRTALRSVHRSLVPRGRFVCTLHNPSVRLARLSDAGTEERRFPRPSGKGEVAFRISCHYDPGTRIVKGVQSFDVFSEAWDLVERREVEIRFCLPDREWFRAAAEEAGFSVESLFGNYDLSEFDEQRSPYMIWLLGKQRGT